MFLRRRLGRDGGDRRVVGVSVDTMMVSAKPRMDTIADVGDVRIPLEQSKPGTINPA
jgi:hypothetical protein